MKQLIIGGLLLFSLNGFSQQSYETITIETDSREYYKYLPTGFDSANESVPLIIIMHGLGGNALQLTAGQYNQVADTARFIPVYLQGLTNTNGTTAWNNGTLLGTTANDVLFISKVIDEMKTLHNIDLSRVYCTGISMGSIMTYKAIRHLDDRIAAVSCHIGTMSSEEIAGYNPTYKVPVQHVHGTADGTVPYDGIAYPSLSLVPQTIDKLKAVNGWVGDSTITNIPDIAADGITIEKIVYNCASPLELWKMNGGGHIYLLPGINDTSGVIISWNFFRQFSHPNPVTVSVNENTFVSGVDFYPNPTNGKLFIKKFQNLKLIEIYNINGKLIKTYSNFNEKIDVSNIVNGFYVLKATTLNNQVIQTKLVIE